MSRKKMDEKIIESQKQVEEKEKIEEVKKELSEDNLKELENKYKKLEEDYLNLKTRYNELENYTKKLKAEFENYKQLVVKEKQQIIRNATEYMIEKLIPIVDNFERALKSINFDDLESLKNFIKGIEMIYKSMLKLLENEGVKVIESSGKKFDPFEHEAVEKVETDDVDEFTVIEEIEKGYKIHSKVLKPAKVKVAIRSLKQQNMDGEDAKN
jgi:molecular chaperone GrpE